MPPSTRTDFVSCHTETLITQIGLWNILATSGGRVIVRNTGITLPVAHGYRVDVDLNWLDYYTVQRIYIRGGKRIIKGVIENVGWEQVGEAVYRAGCYREPLTN